MIKSETSWLNDISECDICGSEKEIGKLIILGPDSICEECFEKACLQALYEELYSEVLQDDPVRYGECEVEND